MTGLLRLLAGRVVLPVAALLAAYGVGLAVLPHFLSPAPPAPVASAVDVLSAAHACQVVPGPGRPMLLIDSPTGGTRLVLAATTADGARAQTDSFYDERVDFYGWCRR